MSENSDDQVWPTPISRRQGLKFSAATVVASMLPGSAFAVQSETQKDAAMTDKTAIRPFHIGFPETELTDLNRRIKMTKWPDREQVGDTTQGVQLETMKQLADHWAHKYDWKKCEAKLAALPNFVTEIDGLDIHFIHVRSKHE